MFNAIYSALGSVLRFFSDLFGGSFLLGLLMFAIIIKIVLLPFGIKQQKNSIRQSKMRPREMAIRKKYAGRNDRPTQQKMQNEIMEMYQQDGYNPMGGCLPMILQMAIILLLYQVIIYPLQHVVGLGADNVAALKTYMSAAAEDGGLGVVFSNAYQEIAMLKEMIARGAETIVGGFKTFCETYTLEGALPYAPNATAFSDAVSAAYAAGLPSFDLFGIQNFLAEIPDIGSLIRFPWTTSVLLVLVPLLNFVAQFFTMKLTRKLTFQPLQDEQNQAMGCNPKIMDWALPALTLFIAFSVPAAIGIYWLFNNLLGMGQTYILHKAMPLPVITEEDIKAAEREMKHGTNNSKKIPNPVEGVRSNPNSLHTIDFEEEDYAVLPDYESIYDKKEEESTDEAPDQTRINGEVVSDNGEPNSKIGTAPLKSNKQTGKKKK